MNSRHSLNRYTAVLVPAGLAINLILSRIALYFDLPLYLDSIGTVLSAALGGYIPGIIVGFFSNVINGISDPITLYYGIINTMIACAAADMSRRGWFSRPGTIGLCIFVFTLIGGVLGSMLTWLLYGFSFGSGISAPFAISLHTGLGLSEFYAQLIADIGLDLADKTITVLICALALRFIPERRLEKLSVYGRWADSANDQSQHPLRVRHSLRGKVVLLISVSAIVLGTASTCIGCVLYTNTMKKHYTATATSVAELAASTLDPEKVNDYLSTLEITEDYIREEAKLKKLAESIPDVEYLYVYQIREDGCHVVFDLDTPGLEGCELGEVIPMEEDFMPYRSALLSGDDIPPLVSTGVYGWLLTDYVPVVDAKGVTVAYAAADISMNDVINDNTIFAIKMASLLLGVSILIVAFALGLAERRLVDPINAIAEAANEFAYDSEQERAQTTARMQNLNIHTGDEIENLHIALKKTVCDVSEYISDISQKGRIISHMQHNIIISFASMVESRDKNTGHHIKNTAAYVDIIARELYREGKYQDTITPEYIEKIVRSAPLHDLGKIEVPDAILNKPGKLTPEEFEIMKNHTTAGRTILLGVIGSSEDPDYLSEALNMTTYHHERWDGAGYPQGLRGEEIPISARIMAVADVYDALVSKRSYKEAFSVEKAVEIIKSESGTHFDPTIVEAFVCAGAGITAAQAV